MSWQCLYLVAVPVFHAARGDQHYANGTLLEDKKRIKFKGEYISHHVGVSCFSEYAVVSRHSLIKIDKTIPLDLAALFGCAVITGVGAVVDTAHGRHCGCYRARRNRFGSSAWRESQWHKKRNWG